MAAAHADNEEPRETDRVNPRTGSASPGPVTPSPALGQPQAQDQPAPPDPAQAQRAWGSRPGRLGPITVVFGAVAGGSLTVVGGFEPGWLLGLFVIIATVAGTTAVRRTSAYMVIPVPALAYFVAAVIAGLIHDRSVDTSRAILLVNAVQWSSDSFPWMVLATVIAIAITIGRWLMTGRAGYGAGGFWLARLSRAWSAPAATSQRTGAVRAPTARPGTARSDSNQSGSSRSATALPAAPRPEDARPQSIPRETVDTEHSAES